MPFFNLPPAAAEPITEGTCLGPTSDKRPAPTRLPGCKMYQFSCSHGVARAAHYALFLASRAGYVDRRGCHLEMVLPGFHARHERDQGLAARFRGTATFDPAPALRRVLSVSRRACKACQSSGQWGGSTMRGRGFISMPMPPPPPPIPPPPPFCRPRCVWHTHKALQPWCRRAQAPAATAHLTGNLVVGFIPCGGRLQTDAAAVTGLYFAFVLFGAVVQMMSSAPKKEVGSAGRCMAGAKVLRA